VAENKVSLIPDNAITELSKKTYDDVAHPTLRELGSIGEGIMKFVALPFKFLGLTAIQLEERYKNFIARSINKVPEEKQVLPQAVIAAPILEQVKYIFNEENPDLEEMFSDLLASAMDKDLQDKVHPIFVNILKQLSPTDARLLNEFFPFDNDLNRLWMETDIAYISSKEERRDGHFYFDKQLALVFVAGYETFKKYHTADVMLTLDILENLGLIIIMRDYNRLKDSGRDSFNEYYKKVLKSRWKNLISIDKIELTMYGEKFLTLCSRRLFK